MTLLPVEGSRRLARLLTAQETGSWPAVRHSWLPASPTVPTSPVGKVNPKDAEVPPSTGSCVGQNPPKASNALLIPTQTSLTQNGDLGSRLILGVLSPSQSRPLALVSTFLGNAVPPSLLSY